MLFFRRLLLLESFGGGAEEAGSSDEVLNSLEAARSRLHSLYARTRKAGAPAGGAGDRQATT